METTTKNINGVKAIRMTAEQVKNDEMKSYNPQEWIKNVDSYLKYENVEFFKIKKGNYDYDRFFVIYTLASGIRFMGKLSYSSSMTSGGFLKAFVNQIEIIINEDETISYKGLEENEVYIQTNLIGWSDGSEGCIGTDEKSRKYMTKCSKDYNQIWTKEYFTY